MKKIILFVALGCMGVSQGFARQQTEILQAYHKLEWETAFSTAFERAKKEHKDVMVMVEEPQCKWCVKMKNGALSNPDVQVKLQDYVLLKVQRSDKESIKQIEGFTAAIPSFHFMTANKETIETIIGYFETEDFLSYLVEIETDN
ncbi:MAG TPA: thioredoxin family protein [Sulfurovum sp.]|nr:MAG: hypothetical protein B7Y63_09295 [Sulfurovum sp. 35-42-20]OYZ25920.1 MAG: hypothetical protein B7Y23_03655 [Sulfurovum sp. 16-42-52]OYZ48404.1 MAG: hypothetical protein B7Y13_07715 [Sulfurovum sp. 24-42-9]OZA46809.1 MAG: hypothetical protein B7X80_01045 [Sulfurovum sp. 17-42-90]OZA59993.1 MAG: hypothetical protein B7X69_05560 [Sulfurovum sp. 39-42-12]HQR73523.1 thioredoxin family protein [Sulfurovum sp.]